MDSSAVKESAASSIADDERLEQLKAFDGTRAGVKGLVDAGITNLPKIFIRSPEELSEEVKHHHHQSDLQVPVIDLSGIGSGDDDEHKKVIYELRQASQNWGFFQLLNHGIPVSVLDGMLDGIRKFHELDAEIKKEYYSREWTKKVRYESNIDLYRSKAANWRDTMTINLFVRDQEPEELPVACRDDIVNYINHVTMLGETLFDLLSEALDLKLENLKEMGCATARTLVCHYYPPCPEPDLTLGVSRHTDPAFLTILLQDQIGGLQCLHDNQWIDVQPIPEGLVVNIADLLQIVSNDKFMSVEHRVVANSRGPRISVACFFSGAALQPRIYEPINELVSEESPVLYKQFTVRDYVNHFFTRPIDESGLEHFKI